MKKWVFDIDKPIFRQISDRLRDEIAAGKYLPGEKFPSVRDLAMAIGVNPNTVQRALASLEDYGILVSRRGDGRYVSDDAELKGRLLDARVKRSCADFALSLRDLGLSDDEIVSALKNTLENGLDVINSDERT